MIESVFLRGRQTHAWIEGGREEEGKRKEQGRKGLISGIFREILSCFVQAEERN